MMRIATDFIPKIGDRIKYTPPSGRERTLVWVVCPRCNNGRWVYKSKTTKLSFTGYCRACNSVEVIKAIRMGHNSPLWKGGRYIHPNGHVMVRIEKGSPFFSMVNKGRLGITRGDRIKHSVWGYIPEHRLIMAQYLNRPLKSWEIVHHINGIKDDNRIENLRLTTMEKHISEERRDIIILQNRVTLLEAENVRLNELLELERLENAHHRYVD